MMWLWFLAPVALATLIIIAIGGRWPVNHNRVPAACVVTARRAYRFPTAAPTVAWRQLIGHIMLVMLAGAFAFFLLAVVLVAVVGP